MFRKKKEQPEEQKTKQPDPKGDQEAKSLVVTIPTVPRYPKPKILLIDLKDDSETVLKAAGYTVVAGTFGTPYKTSKDNSYRPVATDFDLPNYAEQEIVIIDLLPPETLDNPKEEHHSVSGEYDHWAKCNFGVIDPRPVAMSIFRPDFDRILVHGGAFIIFADHHTFYEIVYGRDTSRGLNIRRDMIYDNWSFLTTLHSSRFETQFIQGTEITVPNQKHPLGKILARHLTGTYFNCTLAPKQHFAAANQIYYTNDRFKAWARIATDKYGAPVAGAFFPDDEVSGWIFIFPQVADKSRFLLEFLRDVLPELDPQLFPFAEGGQWIYRDEYQMPSILKMRQQIERIEVEAREKVKAIEEKIQAEQEEKAYLRDLLTETGDPLVKAVKKTFEVLGCQSVLDMDEEMKKTGDTGGRREDLRIVDEPDTLLVEVKGIAGLPADADALQVQKYLIVRMKEWKRTNVHGLEIINHQKGLPPLDREQEMPFRDDILVNAEEQQFGLMTTWDLYRLARSFLKNNWKPEHVKPLFMGLGRIMPVPTHYEFVGVIENFWEKAGAVGVRIQEAAIRIKDRITFDLPIDFEEQIVDSLQVDNEQVMIAEASTLAGIKTHLTKQQLRKGVRVYRVS